MLSVCPHSKGSNFRNSLLSCNGCNHLINLALQAHKLDHGTANTEGDRKLGVKSKYLLNRTSFVVSWHSVHVTVVVFPFDQSHLCGCN